MKLERTLTTIIGVIVFILIFVVWKLNDYYKRERSALAENQIHQQTLNLKTSISSQLSQLKNTISSYQGRVDESKINWVQLSPFYALVQMDISAQGQYTIKNLFVRSGTPAANWSTDYIQKALSYSRFSNKDIHAQLFQNQQGGKFLSLIFSDVKVQNSRQAVAVIGEAQYFQKYFDALRSGRSTNLILTSDTIVVGHTQPDYIATKTQEDQLSDKRYFIDKDQIRSSNLSIVSYSARLTGKEIVYIPMFVLIFVFGFAFILMGLVFYALKPLQSESRKAEIFKKVFDEVRREPPASSKTDMHEAVAAENKPKQFNLDQPKPEGFEGASSIEFEKSALYEDAVSLIETTDDEMLKDETSKDSDFIESIVQEEDMITKGLQKISLPEVIDLSLKSMQEKIINWGGHIEKHYESTLKYEIDVERFQRAIVNLISNSIEASAKEIIIKIYDVQGLRKMVTNIDIIDDGVGIDFGTAEKIWQPFYGTKDKLQHKGLGLAETLSVVNRYGADIKMIENQIGGATFRIEMDMEARGLQSTRSRPEVYESATEPPSVTEISEQDLDIDSILNLDDAVEETTHVVEKTTTVEPAKIDLAKEYTTTQYKIDQRVEILEEPEIQFTRPDKKIDHLTVKVRKPEKI